jgi:hypothetical protein
MQAGGNYVHNRRRMSDLEQEPSLVLTRADDESNKDNYADVVLYI